jgi:hypothetical protein
MVQALAFAEIFLGLILADAGYKGVPVSQVVKGEAGKEVAPNPLGVEASATGQAKETTSPPGVSQPKLGLTRSELPKNSAFGPSPLNSPSVGGFQALSPEEQKQALREGATG